MAKILVVDDDPDLVYGIRLCLESTGHRIITASNGVEGLQKIKNEKPDLIILDVMMETSTEGFQLAIKVRSPDPTSEYKEFQGIPILMLTSIHDTTPVRFGPQDDYLPVDMFVEKPISPDDLIEKVAALLNSS
ncbi:MAG: response regulator [Anaerolineales bacterium]|jgi:CheY-like chemotaxis protein